MWDLDTEVEEVAHELEDVPKLKEFLQQAHRAARGQRAEFARRVVDEFARRDWLGSHSRSQRTHGAAESSGSSSAVAPRLARNTKLEGSVARGKTEEEERQGWVGEVTELVPALKGKAHSKQGNKRAGPQNSRQQE